MKENKLPPHPTGNITGAVNIWRNMVRLEYVCVETSTERLHSCTVSYFFLVDELWTLQASLTDAQTRFGTKGEWSGESSSLLSAAFIKEGKSKVFPIFPIS